MLAVTWRSRRAIVNGWASASRIRFATIIRVSASRSSQSTTNSSPARRATKSEERTASWIRSATATSSRSPAAAPIVSFTALKRSMLIATRPRCLPRSRARAECLSQRFEQSAPVGQPGQLVHEDVRFELQLVGFLRREVTQDRGVDAPLGTAPNRREDGGGVGHECPVVALEQDLAIPAPARHELSRRAFDGGELGRRDDLRG